MEQTFAQGTLGWTVTFDRPPALPAGDEIALTYYSEQGMTFRPIGIGQFGRSGGAVIGRPSNGSAFLVGAYTYSLSVTGYPSLFGVLSVDLAEYSTVVPDPVTVQFVGYRSDGSIVTQDFTTDGVIDGTGPITDFQTFYFGPEFTGLKRLEIPRDSYGWCLDNLAFTIPEPGTVPLLFIGAVLWRALRPRFRR